MITIVQSLKCHFLTCILYFIETEKFLYRLTVNLCHSERQTKLIRSTIPRKIIKRQNASAFRYPAVLTALSISLSAWAFTIYFYQSMSVFPVAIFARAKVVQIGSITSKMEKLGQSPEERSGNGHPKGIPRGDEKEKVKLWQKMRKRTEKEPINKFLRNTLTISVTNYWLLSTYILFFAEIIDRPIIVLIYNNIYYCCINFW